MPNWLSTPFRIKGERLSLPAPAPRSVLASGASVGTPLKEARYTSPWVDFGGADNQTVTYHKDVLGFVRIQGCAKRSAGTAGTNETIFTLPVGYRPDQIYTYAQCANNNIIMAKVVIYPTTHATLPGVVQYAHDGATTAQASAGLYLMCTFKAAPQGNS